MKSVVLASLCCVSSALAHPAVLAKRFNTKSEDTSGFGTSDIAILSYALVLEHLEDTFYRGGLANFTAAQFAAAGYDATFYANLQEVAKDESTHVQVLTSSITGLGATPPKECLYNFPYTDPASFVALASVLEGVGVSAYIGAAAYIASPDYLTAAASILTIEARHSSYFRSKLNEVPFPAPFDTALDFDQVYSLAAPFFVSCPSDSPAIPLKAFPALAVDASGPIAPGSQVTLTTEGYVLSNADSSNDGRLYGAFLTPTGPVFEPATPVTGGYSVTIPTGVSGQSYVVLTACGDKVSDDTTVAGPAILVVGSNATASK